jgi:hypothetical protein
MTSNAPKLPASVKDIKREDIRALPSARNIIYKYDRP